MIHDGRIYVNRVLSFKGDQVFGLSADMLLEALAWGTGQRPERGRERLQELRAYHPSSKPS